jgi:predicted ATP-grasp superfamily ATP-dependent carboligase
MKILLFEWLVGGGTIESDCPLDRKDCFFEQGSAMFSAMVDDFIATGHQVVAPIDVRISQTDPPAAWAQQRRNFHPVLVRTDLRQTLCNLAIDADQIFIIAPESDGILAQCYRWLEAFEDKWCAGPLDWIELASNKNRMQDYLDTNGIAVPPSAIDSGKPWVAKPVSGAGSEDVGVFCGVSRIDEFKDRQAWRVEQYVPGKPVSVSAIANGGSHRLLPPTGQIFDTLSDREMGAYVGAVYPLNNDEAGRATALAKQAVDVLPQFKGYIGIDMILADSGPDVVVEINPRMTMSYCHLPVELRRHWLQSMS